MRVAVIGDVHGQFDRAYAKIADMEREDEKDIDLVLMCGDLKAFRDEGDLDSMKAPEKHRVMNDFEAYYRGRKKVPYLTICISGNHESSNLLSALPYGGWLAPNMYYVGRAGCVTYRGLRIAGLSGIYKPYSAGLPPAGPAPFTEDTIVSAYHQRRADADKLAGVGDVDVLMVHDWPAGILLTPDINKRGIKSTLVKDDKEGRFGSPLATQVMKAVKPQRVFAGHHHHPWSCTVDGAEFTALGNADLKEGSTKKYCEVFDIEPRAPAPEEAGLMLDGAYLTAISGRTIPTTPVPTDTFTRKEPAEDRTVRYTPEPHTAAMVELTGLPSPSAAAPTDETVKRARGAEAYTLPFEYTGRCGVWVDAGRGRSGPITAALDDHLKAAGVTTRVLSYDAYCAAHPGQDEATASSGFLRDVIESVWMVGVTLIVQHPITPHYINKYRNALKQVGSALLLATPPTPALCLASCLAAVTGPHYKSPATDGKTTETLARRIAGELAATADIRALTLDALNPTLPEDTDPKALTQDAAALAEGVAGVGDAGRVTRLLETGDAIDSAPEPAAAALMEKLFPGPVVERMVKATPHRPQGGGLYGTVIDERGPHSIARVSLPAPLIRFIIGHKGTTQRRILKDAMAAGDKARTKRGVVKGADGRAYKPANLSINYRHVDANDSLAMVKIHGEADDVKAAVAKIYRAVVVNKPAEVVSHSVVLSTGSGDRVLGQVRLWTDHHIKLATDAITGAAAGLGAARTVDKYRQAVNQALWTVDLGFVTGTGEAGGAQAVTAGAVRLVPERQGDAVEVKVGV